jgi:hypothetical protein
MMFQWLVSDLTGLDDDRYPLDENDKAEIGTIPGVLDELMARIYTDGRTNRSYVWWSEDSRFMVPEVS